MSTSEGNKKKSRGPGRPKKDASKNTTQVSVPSTSRDSSSERPKRQIIPKKSDNLGVHWREEKEIQKALYASLQLSKNKSLHWPNDQEMSVDGDSSSKGDWSERSRSMPPPCKTTVSTSIESRSTTSSSEPVPSRNSIPAVSNKSKVHAQRKFAPSSASPSPSQRLKSSPMTNRSVPSVPLKPSSTTQGSSNLPSTADWITYMCLNNSEYLPERLKFFDEPGPGHFITLPTSSKGRGNGTPVRGRPPGRGKVVVGKDSNFSAEGTGVARKSVHKGFKLPVAPSSIYTNKKLNSDLHFGKKYLKSPLPRSPISKKQKKGKQLVRQARKVILSLHRPPSSPAPPALTPPAARSTPPPPPPPLPPRLSPATSPAVMTRRQRELLEREKFHEARRETYFNRLNSKPKVEISVKKTPDNVSRVLRSGSAQSSPSTSVASGNSSSPFKAKRALKWDSPKRTLELPVAARTRNSPFHKEDKSPLKLDMPASKKRKLAMCSDNSNEDNNTSADNANTLASCSTSPTHSCIPSLSCVPCTNVPMYYPSRENFDDPIKFFEQIHVEAEPFGMACIVPPFPWTSDLCCVQQELRFRTELQYLNRMRERWGENVKEMECIRRHLANQGTKLECAPLVGGVELDLPSLSRTIKQCGGITAIADDKRKWTKVADMLRIPSCSSQDRGLKLYDAYCKYLLTYDSLSEEEHSHLVSQVTREHKRGRLHVDPIVKNKTRSLPEFFHSAQSMLARWFERPPTAEQVESTYWNIVSKRDEHVAVQSAHLDSISHGSGFPTETDSVYTSSGWNFNVLQENPTSVLKAIGSVSHVTIPELHFGMLFSTVCWSQSQLGMPYIYYLHTGSEIVWYCIPKSEESKFKAALQKLVPSFIDDKLPLWLPVDTLMVSPQELIAEGIKVSRLVQKQGQFVIIYPQSFTSSICCGYNISESMYFATAKWIPIGYQMAQATNESCEDERVSIDQLVYELVRSYRLSTADLKDIVPTLETIIHREIQHRQQLIGAGIKKDEDVVGYTNGRKKKISIMDEDNICSESKKQCYLSMVINESDGRILSLARALPRVQRKKRITAYKLLTRYTEKEMLDLLASAKYRLAESQKKR